MADATGTGTWRDNMPRGVLDPFCWRDEPVWTPTDRRLLWHVESMLAVAATNDTLRDLARDLAAYLAETCEHHWHDFAASEWRHPDTGEVGDMIPAHRQCMWCNTVEDMP